MSNVTLMMLSCMFLLSAVAPAFSFLSECGGRLWLRGGEKRDQDFDVTEFRLDPNGLNFGLGRESFCMAKCASVLGGPAVSDWAEKGDPVGEPKDPPTGSGL